MEGKRKRSGKQWVGEKAREGDVAECREDVEKRRGALRKLARGKREQRVEEKGGNAARAR